MRSLCIGQLLLLCMTRMSAEGLTPTPSGPSRPIAVVLSAAHHRHSAVAGPAWLSTLNECQVCLRAQAPGSLLTAADIGPALEERMAELFWPDDNCWYLVQIKTVDMGKHAAQIAYVTGETEELDLTEISAAGHMSLITRV